MKEEMLILIFDAIAIFRSSKNIFQKNYSLLSWRTLWTHLCWRLLTRLCWTSVWTRSLTSFFLLILLLFTFLLVTHKRVHISLQLDDCVTVPSDTSPQLK